MSQTTLTDYDSELAELRDLGSRVLGTLAAALAGGESFRFTYQSSVEPHLYNELLFWFCPPGFRFWPVDKAAQQLAAWRDQLDGIAA